MPLYQWKGIDLQAVDHKGITQAHSMTELDKQLFCQGIALLSAKKTHIAYPLRRWRALRHEWFAHLAHLLDANIGMPQALMLIELHESHKDLKIIWHDIAQEISYGESLISALEAHSPLFDPLVIQLLAAAHETSEISICLLHIAHYYESLEKWKKELYQRIAGPLVTLLLCSIITLFIFIVMLPLFESFFADADRVINTPSRILFSISHWLQRWGTSISLGGLLATLMGGVVYKKSTLIQQKIYAFLLYVPFIGTIIQQLALYRFLRVLSLLLEGQLSLKPSFEIIVKYQYAQGPLRGVIEQIYALLLQGVSLSDAFAMHNFSKEIIAYVSIGEESSQRAVLLKKASEVCYQNALKRLEYISFYAQPLLLLSIGILIGLLIVCVYMPIINLAYTIC